MSAMSKAHKTEKVFPEGYDADCIEYYSGVEGFTVEEICHPNHLWQIADRIDSEIMMNDNLTVAQKELLQSITEKWLDVAEQYATEFDPA